MKNTEKNWKMKCFYTVGHKLFIIWKYPPTKRKHTATMWCNFGIWISPNSINVVNNKIKYILLRNFTAWQNLHENITILLTGTVCVAAQCANFNNSSQSFWSKAKIKKQEIKNTCIYTVFPVLFTSEFKHTQQSAPHIYTKGWETAKRPSGCLASVDV